MGRLTQTNPNPPPSHQEHFQYTTPENTQTSYNSLQPGASTSDYPPEYLQANQPEVSVGNYHATFQSENSYDDYESSYQSENPEADYESHNPNASYDSSLPSENVDATQPPYPPPQSTAVPQQPVSQPTTQPNYPPRPATYPPENFQARQQPVRPLPNRPVNGPRPPTYQAGNNPAGAQPYLPQGQGYASRPEVNFQMGNLNGGPQQYPPASQPVAFPTGYLTSQSPFHTNAATQGIPVQQVYRPSPAPVFAQNTGTEAWSSGLFDCMNDPELTIITGICPCLTFGQIAEIIDNGHTTCATSGTIYAGLALFLLPCLLSATYRTRLRSRYNLIEAPAPDWATHFICECCALCQEYRELRTRGLDPVLGLQGNIAIMNKSQQGQAIMTMPPMNQSMAG